MTWYPQLAPISLASATEQITMLKASKLAQFCPEGARGELQTTVTTLANLTMGSPPKLKSPTQLLQKAPQLVLVGILIVGLHWSAQACLCHTDNTNRWLAFVSTSLSATCLRLTCAKPCYSPLC